MKVSILFLALMPAKGFVNNGGAKDHASALNLRTSQQYIPKGFTEESWTAFKAKEKREHAKKKHHFQSRPLVDFQRTLRLVKFGKYTIQSNLITFFSHNPNKYSFSHLFPVMFAQQRIKQGQLRPSDVPYEQRVGGKFNNEDVNVGYVPDNMSVHEWHELQRREKKAHQSKNFAAFGPQSFKSRSLQAFQEALDQRKTNHLFPAMNAKERIAQGQMKEEDVPYMQRAGGSWDNSDLKSASKKPDTYEKMQSVLTWLSGGLFSP